MVWGLASCSKDAAQGGNATQNGAKKVKITMKVTAPGSTRATVDGNLTDGYVMNWAEGDSFSLMDDQGNAYRMTLQDGADTPDGIFEGEIDANSARGEIAPGIGFMAINPYVSGNTFASYTIAIPADQTTDDTADGGLGNYLFQWGGAAFDASSGDDKLPAPTVQFEQLSTFWEITIANPSNLSIKSVKVKAADDAVEPDERLAPLGVPNPAPDAFPVAVSGRLLAHIGVVVDGAERQPEQPFRAGLAADDQRRPVLAGVEIVLKWHPGPDDLAGVGQAVGVGVVGEVGKAGEVAGVWPRCGGQRGSRGAALGVVAAAEEGV